MLIILCKKVKATERNSQPQNRLQSRGEGVIKAMLIVIIRNMVKYRLFCSLFNLYI